MCGIIAPVGICTLSGYIFGIAFGKSFTPDQASKLGLAGGFVGFGLGMTSEVISFTTPIGPAIVLSGGIIGSIIGVSLAIQ